MRLPASDTLWLRENSCGSMAVGFVLFSLLGDDAHGLLFEMVLGKWYSDKMHICLSDCVQKCFCIL